jgi:uncharacterized phage-like protein YoqJ
MALGVDTVAAELVLEARSARPDLGIKLIAAIPFADQPMLWPYEAQYRYRTILAQADERVVLFGQDYESWKLLKRNHWMVEQSNLLIAVWNGKPGRSGTGACVRYAQSINREIDIIDPAVVKAKLDEVEKELMA